MDNKNLYDLVIIGSGPAGLSAAIYMARARYKTLVLEKEKIGGQITITDEVVNYPGVFKTSGEELTKEMAKQAESFGAEIKIDEVVSLDLNSEIKEIKTKTTSYKALAVIVATGANPRQLGFEGESKYRGRGVAYCATCDGEFFKEKDIFVIGGGFAACEEAMFLTKFAKSVTMIVREPNFTAAASIADKVLNHKPEIKVHFNSEIKSITGNDLPKQASFINNETKEEWTYKTEDDIFGTFVFAGYVPNTKLVKDILELDKQGYVVTNHECETAIAGVYVAGDLRIKKLRQVITATSDGAICATNAEKYVEQLHHKLNIPSLFVQKQKEETVSIDENRSSKFIDNEMIPQLKSLFDQLEEEVTVVANVNNNDPSSELKEFVSELANISNNVKIAFETTNQQVPYISFKASKEVGYRFYGVPGGHEFTSFVVTLHRYFAARKELNPDIKAKIESLNHDINLDVVISLSCTKCPGLIMALTHLASYNNHLKVNVRDIAYASEYRDKYKIMSVPCTIVDDKELIFGEKDVVELADSLL